MNQFEELSFNVLLDTYNRRMEELITRFNATMDTSYLDGANALKQELAEFWNEDMAAFVPPADDRDYAFVWNYSR